MVVFLGRNRDYQELNLTFAVNVIKHGMIVSFFPKPLKSCVVGSIHPHLFLTPRHTSVLWHACYPTSSFTFDKRWNLSNP